MASTVRSHKTIDLIMISATRLADTSLTPTLIKGPLRNIKYDAFEMLGNLCPWLIKELVWIFLKWVL